MISAVLDVPSAALVAPCLPINVVHVSWLCVAAPPPPQPFCLPGCHTALLLLAVARRGVVLWPRVCCCQGPTGGARAGGRDDARGHWRALVACAARLQTQCWQGESVSCSISCNGSCLCFCFCYTPKSSPPPHRHARMSPRTPGIPCLCPPCPP